MKFLNFLNFLTKRVFYYHLLAAVAASILLLWLVFILLNSYTHHGEAISLPDYSGTSIDKIDSIPNENQFHFILSDSIYDSSKEPGTIIMQNPLAGSKVKRNRKIYFTIVAKMPEMLAMPNLIDLSLRQALVTLQASGLKVNSLQYIPDFAENAVLAQIYQGDTIAPDSLIQIGSKVDLILGKGYNPRKIELPFLIGKTREEVLSFIHRSSLNIGEEIYLGTLEEGTYRIYDQDPHWNSDTLLNYGDFINLWYKSDAEINYRTYIDSLMRDTLKVEELEIVNDSLLLEPVSDTLLSVEGI